MLIIFVYFREWKMEGKQDKNKLKPEKWVSEYGDLLFNYALKRIFDQKQAEDIVQETFLAGLKGVDNFQGKSSEKTWLFAILKNKIIDHYRKKSNQKEEQTNFALPFKESGMFFKHWESGRGPHDWDDGPGSAIDKDEFTRIFRYCLSNLPPKLASVFALKVVEELASDEVCKEVGISSSNFWVIMHRARLQLRECMEKNWLE